LESANVGYVSFKVKKSRQKRESKHYSVGSVRFTDILEFKIEEISIVHAY
jgi:hypothetical protein